MTAWGVSTILIEAGGWEGDPQKQFLREIIFVALGTAVDAIASGTYLDADPAVYEALPPNAELGARISEIGDLAESEGRDVVWTLMPAFGRNVP